MVLKAPGAGFELVARWRLTGKWLVLRARVADEVGDQGSG